MEIMAENQFSLAIVETLKAEVVFAPGGVDAILDALEKEVRDTPTDISTKDGRAAVSSLAYKVSRSKTALDDLGKNLTAEWKAKAALVDADRRRVRERLDILRDEVRQPLTDWEDAERRRVTGHEQELLVIESLASFSVAEPTSEQIMARTDELVARAPREWHEFAKRAADVTVKVKASLAASFDAAIRREVERAELARLRREAEERARRDRDDRLRAEAAQKAREEAEAEAREAARVRAAQEAAERARVDRERLAAEEARQKAERLAESEKRNAQAIAEKAELDRVIALEKARRDAEAAVEAERRRVAEVKAAEAAEAARREANKKHRARIEGEASKALVSLFRSGINSIDQDIAIALAKVVIASIAEGGIPHVKIIY
jgi:colicin import membrane protein